MQMDTSNSDIFLGEAKATTLDELWDEIGLTEDEKDEEMRKMKENLIRVKSDFIAQTLQRCQTANAEIEEIKSKHIRMLTSLGASQADIQVVETSGNTGTIKARYDEVTHNFESFQLLIYNRRYQEFVEFQKQIDFAFEQIGITDKEKREPFDEIGTENLSQERLNQYQHKAKELNREVASREAKFDELRDKISKLSKDLQEPVTQKVTDVIEARKYSDKAFKVLNRYVRELEKLYETRKQHVAEMAVEITKLWDLLRVDETERKQFLEEHNALSQNNVQDCIDEARRLTQLRNENIDEIIVRLRAEITKYCNDLNYSKEQRQEIFDRCEKAPDQETPKDGTNDEVNQTEGQPEETECFDIGESSAEETDPELQRKIDIFTRYDAERVHLRKVHLTSQPIIDLIKQRKEIINDFKELSDPGRMERKYGTNHEEEEDAEAKVKSKLHIEKVTRRHKYVLPRVEKKLKVLLIQFNEQNGEDFLWNGKPIIEKLGHVKVAPSELQQIKRKKSKGQMPRKLLADGPPPPNTTARKSAIPRNMQSMATDTSMSRTRKSTAPHVSGVSY